MPTYDYQCRDCCTRFEAVHGVAAAGPDCPACGGTVRRILLSAPAVHGSMASGRELATRALPACGKGCRCCP